MAAPSRTGSSWGSFFQQAVAGVESRLDTILADNEATTSPSPGHVVATLNNPTRVEAARRGVNPRKTGGELQFTSPSQTLMKTSDLSHHSSVNRKGDHLQERLARAIGNNSASQTSSISEPGCDVLPPNVSEAQSPGFVDSTERNLKEAKPYPNDSHASQTSHRELDSLEGHSQPESGPFVSVYTDPNQNQSQTGKTVAGATDTHNDGGVDPDQEDPDQSVSWDGAKEAQEYLERIDALQAKLHYLVHETVSLARRVAGEATEGSADQKLAEKDERIALLMGEGQDISKADFNHLNTIKKLRAKLAADEKRFAILRRESDEAQKTTRTLHDRMRFLELALAKVRTDARGLDLIESELEEAKADNSTKDILIAELRKQVADSERFGPVDNFNGLQEQLVAQRCRVVELERALAAMEASKTLSEDQHKGNVREIEGSFERERQKARLAELDLRRELQASRPLDILFAAKSLPACRKPTGNTPFSRRRGHIRKRRRESSKISSTDRDSSEFVFCRKRKLEGNREVPVDSGVEA